MQTPPKLRRTLLTSRVCVVLVCLACGSLDNIIVRKSGSTTLPAGSPVSILTQLGFVELATIDVSDDSDFQSRGFSMDDVDSLKIDSLTLEITAPTSGQDFGFLTHINFYASAPGQAPKLVASGGPFQPGLTTIGLDVEDVDLKPYAKAGAFSLGTEVTGHDPQNTTTIKATAALNVDVNVAAILCNSHKSK